MLLGIDVHGNRPRWPQDDSKAKARGAQGEPKMTQKCKPSLWVDLKSDEGEIFLTLFYTQDGSRAKAQGAQDDSKMKGRQAKGGPKMPQTRERDQTKVIARWLKHDSSKNPRWTQENFKMKAQRAHSEPKMDQRWKLEIPKVTQR